MGYAIEKGTAVIAHAFPLPRAELKTIGLIWTGRVSSHFYMLVLPPLFPLIQEDLAVSWTDLGLLIAVFSVSTGIAQLPAGILVDRIGARPVLFAGLVLQAAPFALVPLFPTYWGLMMPVLIAGIANAAFLPADYAILAARVDGARLGRAFGIHVSAGYVGWVVAPPLMLALASVVGWAAAVSGAGLLGLLFAAVAALNRDALSDRAIGVAAGRKGGAADARPSVIGVLTSPPVLLFLLALTLLSFVGVHVPDARKEFDGLSNVLGGPWSMLVPAIFTLILVSFVAGAIADRVGNRERLVAISLVASTISFGISEFDFQPVPIAVWLAVGALLAALAGPAIDLLVLRVCPSGRIGTVFGMLAICRSIGRALSAWAAGALTGSGMAEMVFWLSALTVLLCIAAIYAARAVAR